MQYMLQMGLLQQQTSVYNKNFYVRRNTEAQKPLVAPMIDLQLLAQGMDRKMSYQPEQALVNQVRKQTVDETQQRGGKKSLRLSTKNFPFLPESFIYIINN